MEVIYTFQLGYHGVWRCEEKSREIKRLFVLKRNAIGIVLKCKERQRYMENSVNIKWLDLN